ncbi:hypothetical protein K438DRAFT_1258734 [Mycena galopus ATCC 62051]|nr:hypothetical protein K438DRAFT_1258734 [Mycena galopus ATCC 62051]
MLRYLPFFLGRLRLVSLPTAFPGGAAAKHRRAPEPESHPQPCVQSSHALRIADPHTACACFSTFAPSHASLPHLLQSKYKTRPQDCKQWRRVGQHEVRCDGGEKKKEAGGGGRGAEQRTNVRGEGGRGVENERGLTTTFAYLVRPLPPPTSAWTCRRCHGPSQATESPPAHTHTGAFWVAHLVRLSHRSHSSTKSEVLRTNAMPPRMTPVHYALCVADRRSLHPRAGASAHSWPLPSWHLLLKHDARDHKQRRAGTGTC